MRIYWFASSLKGIRQKLKNQSFKFQSHIHLPEAYEV